MPGAAEYVWKFSGEGGGGERFRKKQQSGGWGLAIVPSPSPSAAPGCSYDALEITVTPVRRRQIFPDHDIIACTVCQRSTLFPGLFDLPSDKKPRKERALGTRDVEA